MSPFRASILVLFALAGCAAERVREPSAGAVDPATRLALEVPLLVDPDLTTQSRRFAVMSDPVPADGSLPLDDFAPATVAEARADARRMGGTPKSRPLAEVACPACAAPTLSLRAAALGKDCGGKLVAAMQQGARMPAEMPLYPRAHLREAGAVQGSCPIQAASFTAPASAAEVLAFYRGMAAKAGFALRAERGGTSLIGQRAGDGMRFAVIARPRPGETSQIDLIVSGL